MEGSGLYGRPAAGVLADAGMTVVEVPPHMTAAARRRQRTGSKTDPGDALAIARVRLREPALPPPRPHGAIEELRCLVRYRRELVADRTRQVNRLHADLEQLRPGYHQRVGRLSTTKALDRTARLLRGDTTSRAQVARNRIKTLRSLQRTIDGLAAETRGAVDTTGTTLRQIDGIGHLTAADILTEVGDPARFPNKAAFAMANGTAPIEASSGRVQRHRLNRGGNRQLNKAIHTAALTQIAHRHTEGRRYYQRCRDRGKTKREAIRALKRRISDRIWTHLNTHPLT
ncbi:IS110 family transposase [Candidatus Poriferisodalis sp.]|uniref:IS110 family transposase n=1 Tax=Candidatus Poriferisodalis sp. TaxID=3101277 RepID=UPI003B5CFD9D